MAVQSTSGEKNPLSARILAIWASLTEPSVQLADHETRRRARLLASILVPIVILAVPITLGFLIDPMSSQSMVAVFATAIIVVAYVCSRTRFYKVAAILAVAVFPVAALVMTIGAFEETADTSAMYFLVSSILIASILLPARQTVIVAVLNGLSIFVLPLALPGISFALYINVLIFVVFVSTLIVLIAFLREHDLQRIDRQIVQLHAAESRLQSMADAEAETRQSLETRVADYTDFVQAVAQGDLTLELALQDSDTLVSGEAMLHNLGEYLNRMVASLTAMVRRTQEVGIQIGTATNEIMAALTQQMSASTEQSASVAQTLATVLEIQEVVRRTAEGAEHVAGLANHSVEVGQRGMEAVRGSVESMQLIRERVGVIGENIQSLSERMQQIGEIITVVNGLAEQSKLLALNASIEAASAGERGKGFAVVAMEVRSLAEQSRRATEQIRTILGEIQQATNLSVMATEEGMKGVDSGQAVIDRAGQTIQELGAIIGEAAQATGQIASSARQQSNGMEQLITAMTAIRQAAVQTQAATRQAEQAAHGLASLAQQMQSEIARYKLA